MNIAVTVSNERVAPCFSGVSLWILEGDAPLEQREVRDTTGWQVVMWARELMRCNVNVLLCSGVDRFLLGSLQGHGIEVVPDAIGDPGDVLGQWRSGELKLSSERPRHICGGGRRERNRARCRRRR